MKDGEQDVRARLLEAARNEFFERGYERASLRRICAGAGVTTGALYFLFENKADLFHQVVKGTLDALAALSQELSDRELEDQSVGVDNEKYLLEFIWKNQKDITILVEKAEGSPYEGFWEELSHGMEDSFAVFFGINGIEEPDRELIRILAKMKMTGYMELIRGGYTLERTLELAEAVGWYTEGGFESLMEQLKNRM